MLLPFAERIAFHVPLVLQGIDFITGSAFFFFFSGGLIKWKFAE